MSVKKKNKTKTALLSSVPLASSLFHHGHLQIPTPSCASWESGSLPSPLVFSLEGETLDRLARRYIKPIERPLGLWRGPKAAQRPSWASDPHPMW